MKNAKFKDMKFIKSFLIVFALLANINLEAKGPEGPPKTPANTTQSTSWRADCVRSTVQIDMQVNNVRARLKIGGDLWSTAAYIVPKPSPGKLPVSAIYSGGVWIGGVDRVGNTKLSAITYGAEGYDFFAGPLDLSGTTEKQVCDDWNRFFVVTGINVRNHYNRSSKAIEDGIPVEKDSITDDVLYWPGKGNPFWREKFKFSLPDQNLGAYWDQDGDDTYDPTKGDFPVIDIRGCEPLNRDEAKELIPDEMVFWIYNDKGGPQTLSGPSAIQMEVQVQSFAYSTNDEINDMTFYRYKLINKANEDLRDCYFSMWIDPDLGCYSDDYIGCDVSRSLAYVYNQDAIDGVNGANCNGVATYGSEIPILGMDYFRGPLGPKVFKRDTITGEIIRDADGKVILLNPRPFTGEQDTLVELGMTSFTYTENGGIGSPAPGTTDPQRGRDAGFYNLIRGFWRDSTAVTYGGTGYNPGSTDSVKFVFPDDPSSKDPETWSMCSTVLPFGDRRTLQATGPLLLQPSATNELILGVVFVPDLSYPCPDITRLRFADDIAQALFDNCFDITDGPDAPDITAVELDRELIILLSNETTSNNFGETYEEVDLQAPNGVDSTYKFEGYRIYQLVNPGVTGQELGNIEKARPIATIDVKNKIKEIYNWTGTVNPLDPLFGPTIWTPSKMVTGNDAGVTNSIRITEDQFAKTDRRLINHKQYYFIAVAYAYNNWKPFDIITGTGQRKAYLEGRGNVGGPDKKPYTLVPRPIVYDNLNAAYGDGAVVTRVAGEGNPAVFLEVEDGMRDAMLNPNFDGRIIYKSGLGPVSAKVVNPLIIKDGKYKLEISGEFNNPSGTCAYKDAKWTLTEITNGASKVLLQDRPLSFAKEYILNNLGFSVTLQETDEVGVLNAQKGVGAVGAAVEYKDPNGPRWFNAVRDGGIYQTTSEGAQALDILDVVRTVPGDPKNELGQMGAGFFIPFAYAKYEDAEQPFFISPATRILANNGILHNATNSLLKVKDLNNVDIVFTKDKSKWSKCAVVETGFEFYTRTIGLKTVGNAQNFELRQSPSVGTDGKPLNDGTVGFSYFPGYAVDVETGERLNIFFGENSVLGDSLATIAKVLDGGIPLGSDMIFNPSSQVFNTGANVLPMGGQHHIYVTRQKYDECAALAVKFKKGTGTLTRVKGMAAITWTAFPLGITSAPLLSIEQGLIPNDMVYKLRVNNPYSRSKGFNIENTNQCVTENDSPVYEFEFKGKQASTLVQEEYAGALANVNVVPNPYYAYSAYETSQFTNTIKITNLPSRAIVTIYSIDGSFIKQYNRDERGRNLPGSNRPTSTTQVFPDLEWDLKNFRDVPVASGVYLIHISAPELGEERTIKWFGIGRKFDPSGL